MEKPKNGRSATSTAPDPEVDARPQRRRFTADEKLRVLKEADACKEAGDVGALLRREGLYSSHLSHWRKARDEGALSTLSRQRGPKVRRDPLRKEVERLQRENERLQQRLDQAEVIIEVQKKLLGSWASP